MAKTSSARQDLLDAGAELFRERGYEGVGVAQLLETSGAPRGSLYFHFPGGKEQIGAEVVRLVGGRVAERFRQLGESGVDLDTYVERVFKASAKEVKDRDFKACCPVAAIAGEVSHLSPQLVEAVRDVFASWEAEIACAGEQRGMSAENARTFASALLAAMEGASVVSKAQGNIDAHVNAARAMQALARAFVTTS